MITRAHCFAPADVRSRARAAPRAARQTFAPAAGRVAVRSFSSAHVRLRVARFFFFFQAEDGIRDATVTGVQTCALPIYLNNNLYVKLSQCLVHAGATN